MGPRREVDPNFFAISSDVGDSYNHEVGSTSINSDAAFGHFEERNYQGRRTAAIPYAQRLGPYDVNGAVAS